MSQRTLRIAIAVLAIVLIVAGWSFYAARSHGPDNVIDLSGRIEGDDSAVASKQPGRVLTINVREGDSVVAGQVIATLDSDQARAAVADAQARVSLAQGQVPVLEAQQRQAQMASAQSTVGSNGNIGEAQSEVDAAKSQLAQAEAAYKLAAYTQRMSDSLYKTGDVPELQRNAQPRTRSKPRTPSTPHGIARARPNRHSAPPPRPTRTRRSTNSKRWRLARRFRNKVPPSRRPWRNSPKRARI